MSLDYFLKIPDVPGEVARVGHENEIEILSFSWGVANAARPGVGTGRAGAGRLEASDLTVMKTTDRASAPLMALCALGKAIGQDVVLTGAFGGGGFQNARVLTASLDVVRYILKGAMISSVSVSGSTGGDDRPIESISIAYSALRFEYLVEGKLVNAADINLGRVR
jgi:type VI secretion system secreted protein Hcp